MCKCLEKHSQKSEIKENNARKRSETTGKQVHSTTDIKNWDLFSFDSREVMDKLKGSTECSFPKLDKFIWDFPYIADTKII